MEVDMKQLHKIGYQYLTMKKPLFIHGPPGIGKSDSVKQMAKKIAKEKGKEYLFNKIDPAKFCLMDVRISSLDPSDLRGIPFPEKDTTRWLPPSWLPKDPDSEGIIFLDEVNLSPPSMQAAAYELILDRKIGEYHLPKGWAIIAAGNRACDSANVFPMSAPLKNRFSHVTLLKPKVKEWSEWAIEHDIRSEIIGYLFFEESSMYQAEKDSKDSSFDAFPTHRSWAVAGHMIKDIESAEEQYPLVASCVGVATAIKYKAFVKLKEKISLEEIIANPAKIKTIKAPDIKYLIICGLAERYRKEIKDKTIKESKILPVMIEISDNLDIEFGIFLLRLAKQTNKDKFVEALMKTKGWSSIYNKYSKFLL